MTNSLLPAALLLLIAFLWIYSTTLARSAYPQLRNQVICLLIAHPDDEAMFFSPTLLALTAPAMNNQVQILCLSSGNADNLGAIRTKEILASAIRLGLSSTADVTVLGDPAFPDSMHTTWPSETIAAVLASTYDPPVTDEAVAAAMGKSAASFPRRITTLITFDRHGVSAHPNHISLFHGACAWLRARTVRQAQVYPVALYTLTTTNVFRKYASVLDAPLTMVLADRMHAVLGLWRRQGRGKRERKKYAEQRRQMPEYHQQYQPQESQMEVWPEPLVYVSDMAGFARARGAMTAAHQSQMRWFRWGWIAVGRYMVVNDLKLEMLG